MLAKSFDKQSNCRFNQIYVGRDLKYPVTKAEENLVNLYNETQHLHQQFWTQQNNLYKTLSKENKLSKERFGQLQEYHRTWRTNNARIVALQWRCWAEQYLPFIRVKK